LVKDRGNVALHIGKFAIFAWPIRARRGALGLASALSLLS